MPKPKSIDEAIQILENLDELHGIAILYVDETQIWQESVEEIFQYLHNRCQKFVTKAFKANLKSPYAFTIEINHVKCLEFGIHQQNGRTEWDSRVISKCFINLRKSYYQTEKKEYYYMACTHLIAAFKHLKKFQGLLNKYSKLNYSTNGKDNRRAIPKCL